MKTYMFESADAMVHGVLQTYCKLRGQSVLREDFLQLLHALKDILPPHALSDLWDTIKLYQDKPQDIESMMPRVDGMRESVFRECVRRFHERADSPSLTYPADFSQEYHRVLRSASQWSSECLGPPQEEDMNKDLLADANWGPAQHGLMVKAMKDLDDEALRFKLGLYGMCKLYEASRAVPDRPARQNLQHAVSELERRADRLRPLEAKRRQLWPRYCVFAKPKSHSVQIKREAERETAREPTQSLSFGPAEEEAYTRLDGPFAPEFYNPPTQARLNGPFQSEGYID